jgi:hypothetical protein
MNSNLLTRWTAIITNIAVVIGLGFVGLEFRNNSKSIEAERIDSFIGGAAEIDSLIVENDDLAEILFQSYADPDSLVDSDLVRIENWMIMHYDNFRRQTLAHQSNLLPDDVYEQQTAGIGFVFSSSIGLEIIELFRASALDDEVWEAIGKSASKARAYCLDSNNSCLDRFEGL